MSQRAWVEINLANLLENARTVQAAAGGISLLPMVKANAYGLGVLEAVGALEAVDPWGYGVATVPEGLELRAAGIARPILVFTPPVPDQLDVYRQSSLTAVLDDPTVAGGWTLPYHVEIDTGMGRCGVRWSDTDALRACAGAHLEGAFTHFYAADTNPAATAEQEERFRTAAAQFPTRPRLLHAANSAGAWRMHDRLDLCRPGIFLYGGKAGDGLADPLPVVSVRAAVVSVRTLEPGDTVSYGAEWRAPHVTRVATLAIGYADGVLRAGQGRAHVLLSGARYPVVGRVTMDFIMADVGVDTPVRVGDVATVIGTSGPEAITIDDVAEWAGTISYEVIARLGPRLVRRYVT